jgi:dolichyl-phosphate-mannose--protein O-mannosyl transferase
VIPESLDAETLRWMILVALALIVFAMYAIIRFVQKRVTRALMLALLVVIGIALYVERENLTDCVDTCSCTLFGEDVHIPENRNTGNCQ